MAETFTIKLQGAKELEENLRKLGTQISRNLGTEAVRAGGKPIVEEAKRLVPVDTGDLEKSIKLIWSKPDAKDEISVRIGLGKPAGWRAHFTEFGTKFQPAQPFMRPALDGEAGGALNEIVRVLSEGIENEEYKNAATNLTDLPEE